MRRLPMVSLSVILTAACQSGMVLDDSATLLPVEVQAVLLEAGCPVGLEWSGSRMPEPPLMTGLPVLSTDDLRRFIGRFSAVQTEYSAALDGDVVSIRPRGLTSATLERLVSVAPDTAIDAERAIQVLLSYIDPSLPRFGRGAVLGGLGTNAPPTELGPFAIPGGTMTLRQGLNAIIRQHPKHGWIARTHAVQGRAIIESITVVKRGGWAASIPFRDPGA